MTAVNAVASSSKRPAPTTAGPSAKRPRQSTPSMHGDGDEDDEHDFEHDHDRDLSVGHNHDDVLAELDDETKAKIARKEARTIRNRESAQRSRNQRKAHLANLEQRVLELEAENRALRGDAPPPPSLAAKASPAPSFREASPAQSVMSLASDLGIPTELVSGTGVKLSNVAPPPADLHLDDVKPVIPSSPELISETTTTTTATAIPVGDESSLDALKAENAALRERVSLLENLVKQVVAVANLSGLNDKSQMTEQQSSAEIVSPITANNIDWAAFLSLPVHIPNVNVHAPAPGLDATLSPPLFPTTLAEVPEPPVSSTTGTGQQSEITQTLYSNENTSNPVARHPAAVATTTSVSPLARYGPAAGEGDYLDVVFNGYEAAVHANSSAHGSAGAGIGSETTGNGGKISGGFGSSTGLDINTSGNYDQLFHFQPQGGAGGQMDWEVEGGQVPAEVESWDEAMRSLIEDIEGRNGQHAGGASVSGSASGNAVQGEEEGEGEGDVLGMEWFSNGTGQLIA